jgi:DNA-binding transcriptional LysR family regulator
VPRRRHRRTGRRRSSAWLVDRGVHVEPALRLSSAEAVKRAVAAGLGVAIVSKLAAGPERATKQLMIVPLSGPPLRRPFYHVRLRAKRESKAAHAFLCMLKHAVRGTLPKLNGGRAKHT